MATKLKNGIHCFFGMGRDVGLGITGSTPYYCAVLFTVEDGEVTKHDFLSFTGDKKACIESLKRRRTSHRVYAGGALTFDPPVHSVATFEREATEFTPLTLEDLYHVSVGLGIE